MVEKKSRGLTNTCVCLSVCHYGKMQLLNKLI